MAGTKLNYRSRRGHLHRIEYFAKSFRVNDAPVIFSGVPIGAQELDRIFRMIDAIEVVSNVPTLRLGWRARLRQQFGRKRRD